MHIRSALVAAVLVSAAAATGCSSGASASPSDPAAASASASAGAAATPGDSDAAACEGFGDVLTITANADIALDEDRIALQEHDGWYRLATRVLDRVPQGESDDVRHAIAALQDAAPRIALGAAWPTGIGSDAWNEALPRIRDACDEAGSELATEAFTGG